MLGKLSCPGNTKIVKKNYIEEPDDRVINPV